MKRLAAALALSAMALSGCGSAVERLDNSFAEWNYSSCTPEERAEWKASGEEPPLGDGCYGDINTGMSQEQWQENAEIQEDLERRWDADPKPAPEQEPLWETDGGGGGGCVYDPTMNYDWHDDYVCGGERQYFLPNDDFVEQWELDAAAEEWEYYNN
jgi:hypothetical protein